MIKQGTPSIVVLRKEHFQHQAVLMKRKVTAIIAFATTIFLLCIENVKAFAAPFSSPDTLMMLATGAHSLAKRWKNSSNISSSSSSRSPPQAATNLSASNVSATTNVLGASTESNQSAFKTVASNAFFSHSQRTSTTSLRMAFGFGVPAPSPTPSPTMLDMKTSINAFGSWYNQMDPVARPPIYDE
jgi:hypothetical protein